MSSETERPVPLKELKVWSAILEEIARDLLDALDPKKVAEISRPPAMDNARFMVDFLRDKIEPYVKEGISIQRLTEDVAILNEQKELMRLRRPDWDKEQYQALIEKARRNEGADENNK